MLVYDKILVRSRNPQLQNAVKLIVRAVLSKEIAANVAEPLKSQIIARADETIKFITDDYCGTVGHSTKPPRPMPAPPQPAMALAMALAGLANISLQQGSLRTEMMTIAGDLTTKAYASSGLA